MFHITPSRHLFVWSYLFILEGCLTCLWAIIAYFILPKDIAHAYFLDATEKKVAETRMQLESMENRNDHFVWSEALTEFKTIHGYARMLIAFSVGILPNSSANFLAILTVRLGYSVTKTNLVSPDHPSHQPDAGPGPKCIVADLPNKKQYTVAPALTAAVFLLVFAYSSDHFRERGFHMTAPLVLSVIGYAILLAVDIEKQIGIGYMAIFFCTIGVSAKHLHRLLQSDRLSSGVPNERHILCLDCREHPEPERSGFHHRFLVGVSELHGARYIQHLLRR